MNLEIEVSFIESVETYLDAKGGSGTRVIRFTTTRNVEMVVMIRYCGQKGR